MEQMISTQLKLKNPFKLLLTNIAKHLLARLFGLIELTH
jgi:hypothetical protein